MKKSRLEAFSDGVIASSPLWLLPDRRIERMLVKREKE
jgi:hypothetical protein